MEPAFDIISRIFSSPVVMISRCSGAKVFEKWAAASRSLTVRIAVFRVPSGRLGVSSKILRTLDAGETRQRQNHVYRLKNKFALDVADALREWLNSERQVQGTAPGLASPFQQIEREVVIVPEVSSNSLIVSATPRYFEEIRDMVASLDEAPAQVVIQALLVEVELENTDEFGVELGFQDSLLFDRSLTSDSDLTTIQNTFQNASGTTTTSQRIVSQATSPGFLFNNPNFPLGNNLTANPSSVGSQVLNSFDLGRINSDLGFGGLVLSASSSSINVLLRALSTRRNVHILSRPMIRTIDNERAVVQVGQQVPVIDSVQAGLAATTPNIRQQEVGIVLDVTPRITPDETIVMHVIATKSGLSADTVPVFFDASNQTTVEAAVIDKTQAEATVSVPNGQTIVLGGMITKSEATIQSKVPWLGDIPVLGRAFRHDSTTTRRTELLVFLTPRIIRTDADSELIKRIESERIHFIEEEAEAVHGPLYNIPRESEVGPFLPHHREEGMFPLPSLPEQSLPDEQGVPTTRMQGAFDGYYNDDTSQYSAFQTRVLSGQRSAWTGPRRIRPRRNRGMTGTLFRPIRRKDRQAEAFPENRHWRQDN